MLFASLPFAVLFLVTATLFWSLRGRRTAQKWVLLAASIAFYSPLGWWRLLLLVGSAVVNYGLGEALAAVPRKENGEAGDRARPIFYAAMVANLGFLGFFKYYGFFSTEVNRVSGWLGLDAPLPILEIVLPIGISFYTFQSCTYLVDLYRGYGARASNLRDYVLYIVFFPQLLIGPITRSRDLIPQLEGEGPSGVPDLSRASTLVLSGAFKTVVLSSYLASALNDCYASPDEYASTELLVATYGKSMQVYCDFSGYTDFARGFALLLGFELPRNFNQPHGATNIAEFWRRWHMTFAHCMRDYIFLPMGGSWGSYPRTYINLFLTLLVAGLWHGAAWGFVIWGAMHGIGLILFKMLQDWRRANGRNPKEMTFPLWYSAIAWFYTLHLIVISRFFFYTPDVETALTFIRQLLSFTTQGRGMSWLVVATIALVFAMNFFGNAWRQRFIDFQESLPAPARPVLWLAVLFGIAVLQPSAVNPNVYFGF
ncbi:MAG: MBOAT family protein [Deltaproteobacteria bacterium]|nr:MAG: MBOAT family protein [Deltaproteobacteria bacterium]